MKRRKAWESPFDPRLSDEDDAWQMNLRVAKGDKTFVFPEEVWTKFFTSQDIVAFCRENKIRFTNYYWCANQFVMNCRTDYDAVRLAFLINEQQSFDFL